VVKIRLARHGNKKNPIYRVVVADSREPRDGKTLETIGRYNPQHDPSLIEIDVDKAQAWLDKGAQPTDQVAKLLKILKIEKPATAEKA
jgi:small subunit ribosomal protein S16